MKNFHLFELLSVLLTATATVHASFCTHDGLNGMVQPFPAKKKKSRWLVAPTPLKAGNGGLPDGINDPFPMKEQALLDKLATPTTGIDSVKSLDKADGLPSYNGKFEDLSLPTSLSSPTGNKDGYFAFKFDNSKTVEFLESMQKSLEESRKTVPSYGDISGGLDKVVSDVKGSVSLDGSREAMLGAKKQMVDGIVEFYSSETIQGQKAKLIEFGDMYMNSLETRYHFSELRDSIVTGDMLKNAIYFILDKCQEFLDAFNLEQNAAFVLLLVSIFWGSVQRRDGIEYGKKLSQKRIDSMEVQLEKTKSAAKSESESNTAQIKSLEEKMDVLQSQVEALTVAAQQVAQQLDRQAREAETEKEMAASTVTVAAKEAESGIATLEADPHEMKTTVALEVNGVEESTGFEEMEMDSSPNKHKAPSKVKGVKASEDATATKKEQKKNGVAKKTKMVKIKKKKKTKSAETPAEEPKMMETEELETPEVKTEAPATSTVPDWGTYSESTLKRKTVKELTGYLTTKGVDVTDESGKLLKKDSLVGLVLSG